MKDDSQDERTPKQTPERKLPYERPAVISDEVFETLALSCASARLVCTPTSQS